MRLSEQRRKETGAFYTPKIWADKAVEYIADVLGDLTKYAFYDPAAGEGALLESLPQGCEKYASTLEFEDVKILRQKGIKAVQFDFLREDNILMLPYEIIRPRRQLVIFTNPPFFTVGGSLRGCYTRRTYQMTAAEALFLLRARLELNAAYICSFTKGDIWTAPSFEMFRQIFGPGYKKGFLCPSFSWPGLKGRWPVAFSIFKI